MTDDNFMNGGKKANLLLVSYIFRHFNSISFYHKLKKSIGLSDEVMLDHLHIVLPENTRVKSGDHNY